MNDQTYISYRHDNRPNQVLATYAIRTGRRPELVIAHPSERDAIARILSGGAAEVEGPDNIPVDTLPHGGPHPGEVWLQ